MSLATGLSFSLANPAPIHGEIPSIPVHGRPGLGYASPLRESAPSSPSATPLSVPPGSPVPLLLPRLKSAAARRLTLAVLEDGCGGEFRSSGSAGAIPGGGGGWDRGPGAVHSSAAWRKRLGEIRAPLSTGNSSPPDAAAAEFHVGSFVINTGLASASGHGGASHYAGEETCSASVQEAGRDCGIFAGLATPLAIPVELGLGGGSGEGEVQVEEEFPFLGGGTGGPLPGTEGVASSSGRAWLHLRGSEGGAYADPSQQHDSVRRARTATLSAPQCQGQFDPHKKNQRRWRLTDPMVSNLILPFQRFGVSPARRASLKKTVSASVSVSSVCEQVISFGHASNPKARVEEKRPRFRMWRGPVLSGKGWDVGDGGCDSEVESFFQQLWHIPWHLACPTSVPQPIKRSPSAPRVPLIPLVAVAAEESWGTACLGEEEEGSRCLPSDLMAGRGTGKGRGRGGGGNQDQWPPQQMQPQQMQPQQFQQQQQMQMGFGQAPPFGFPPQPYGFMPGAMPPPWGFNGPYQNFPQNPQFGVQSNQWINPQQMAPLSQQQQQSQGSSDQSGKSKTQPKSKKKLVASQKEQSPSAVLGNSVQMNYTSSICMCCGEPGHHQATCEKEPMCFIYKANAHTTDVCPVRKRPRQMAKYIGSGASGLGFYHVELPEVVLNPVASAKNCGMVVVEGGELSREELFSEFSKIYKTNWPWQIRELGHPGIYLVKFPPHIKVEQVIGYPRFGLSKEGIWVKVEAWNDDPEPVEVLTGTWIKVTGLQTKWCEWTSLEQAISPVGILLDVDWLSVFRDNAQEVRLLVNCRDPTKVPAGRLFGFHGGLFNLGFTVDRVVSTDDGDDLLGEELEDNNRRNGNVKGGQSGPDDGRLGGLPPTSNGTPNHGQQGTGGGQHTQRPGLDAVVQDGNEVSTASEVYQLLIRKGVIDKSGAFVWDQTPRDISVTREVSKFWYSEKMLKEPFHQKLEDAAEVEFSLPEDIMPDYAAEKVVKSSEVMLEPVTKRQKQKWGPVQPVRQSSRIDRSKNIIEKAQELKKVMNLEIPKIKGLQAGSILPAGLEGTIQRTRRRFGRSVHGSTTHQAKKAAVPAGGVICKDFGWVSSWKDGGISSYGGRAPLEYLSAHPEDAHNIHVVL